MAKQPKTGLESLTWEEFLALSYEERGRWFRRNPKTRELRRRLLALGGERVVPMPERDVDALLRRGRVFRYKRFRSMRGEPSRCHANALRAWLRRRVRGLRVVTGWTLSEDGSWRQHTWGEQDGACVEANGSGAVRYGMVLNTAACVRFAVSILPPEPFRVALKRDPVIAEAFRRECERIGVVVPS